MNTLTDSTDIDTTESTHNGKIGRLPRELREQLNRRLDQNEPGGRILDWLNALPAVQAVLQADFKGDRVNPQNLSNWRRGGYQHWLKQQERRARVRELAENAAELAADGGGAATGDHLSAVLLADFAVAVQATLAAISDPGERCARLQEFLQTLTRVRRQDCAAERLVIERERRERERAQEQADAEARQAMAQALEPLTRQFQREKLTDLFNRPDLASQMEACREAKEWLGALKTEPAGGPKQAGSR